MERICEGCKAKTPELIPLDLIGGVMLCGYCQLDLEWEDFEEHENELQENE
jgi:hypothetical protein